MFAQPTLNLLLNVITWACNTPKTKNRTITFKPQFIINEETFEHSSKLDEDFSIMQEEFKEFLKRQEIEIKNAFNLEHF